MHPFSNAYGIWNLFIVIFPAILWISFDQKVVIGGGIFSVMHLEFRNSFSPFFFPAILGLSCDQQFDTLFIVTLADITYSFPT